MPTERARLKHYIRVLTLGAATAFAIVPAAGGSMALAEAAPHWAVTSIAQPTDFSATDDQRCETQSVCDSYSVTVMNVGAVASSGSPIVIKDSLPEGLTIQGIVAHDLARNELEEEFAELLGLAKPECSVSPLECTYAERLPPGDALQITIKATVAANAPATVTNLAEAEGGGAAPAATTEPSTQANPVGPTQAGFGVQSFAVGVYGADGNVDSQAGDHPEALTTSFDLTSDIWANASGQRAYIPVQDPKTITVNLPMGLVGDPQAAPQCPEADLNGAGSGCPPDTQIGTVILNRLGQEEYSGRSRVVKVGTEEISVSPPEVSDIYNMVPENGYPATFGFRFIAATVLMYARVVPTSRGYMVRVTAPDIPHVTGGLKVNGAVLTFFGDPAARDHTGRRTGFLTNPTRCAGPADLLTARLEATSWVNPTQPAVAEAPVYPQITGCNLLQFNPSIAVAPDVTQADTPAGYEVDLSVPQMPELSPELATPDLKDAAVELPEGVSLSPSAADGLEGCTESEINLLGTETAADGLEHAARGHCPAKSQIGNVTIQTPVLQEKLEGHLYVASPKCGAAEQPPCSEASAQNGELYGLYMEVGGEPGEESGVIIKLQGTVSANQSTGQLTATFRENPQLPFSELRVRLDGGQRAPLANPQTCGEAQTTSVLEPWSAPESGPNAMPSSPFEVTDCGSSMGFSPSFEAGTEKPLGGEFSPFTMTLKRNDGEQDLAGVSLTLPPGVAGMVSKVPLCPEPQASLGTCSEASRIGTVHAAAGAGSEPLWLEGPVYLTGSYKGAPFGLSVGVPAVAGPFNLGNVIERAAIDVNPKTAQVTVTSDPFPQIRDGVPLRLKTVNVTVDRPGFTFNPTNCSQLHVTGSVSGDMPDGSSGATVPVSSSFAAAGCKDLPFKPKFTVSTQGKTSKADGASLDVKIASKGGPQAGGGEANVKAVKVDLPKQLPSRLTTLQKACTAAVFNANPAGCPAASDVGTATATTPIFSHPLTGPAYIVSHGGEAFPDLEIVLQGEGIKLILDGNTNIKKGITSSTFRSVPDAPISSFELKLPAGPYSILGTNLPASAKYSLCGQKLALPTAFVGQNGAEIHTSTPLSVTGCKPALRVVRHSVKGTTATIVVSVPSAGKLVATGSGLSRAAVKAGKGGTVTVRLALSKNEQSFLSRHPGRRLRVPIKLLFTPKHGSRLSSHVTVLMG